jgi:hypothetical protein
MSGEMSASDMARKRWAGVDPAERSALMRAAAAASPATKGQPAACPRCGAPCASKRAAREHCKAKMKRKQRDTTFLNALGIDWRKDDFHALTSAQVDGIVDEARRVGYRKPRNANGSTARYFYEGIQRQYCKTTGA